LVQFSDVHAVASHRRDDPETVQKAIRQERLWMKQRLDFATQFHETYDPEVLLSSVECLTQLIDYSNRNHPDLVLLTGDIIDYYSPSNHALLKGALDRLEVPYLFSCGNHESPAERFQEVCQGNCDFSQAEFADFRVVSLNDSDRSVRFSQLHALEKLLESNKPILLALHIPIMTEYNQTELEKLDSYYSIRFSDCDEITHHFIRLVSESSQIQAVFCGHTHGSMTTLIAPGKPQFCCSSGLIGHINRITIK
jgi:predicted MPP superfamily phosphohydrolase